MNHCAGCGVRKKPLAELAHCPAFDLLIDRFMHSVLNGPCDVVLLIGNSRLLAQHPQRHFSQDEPGSDALGGCLGGHIRQPFPRLFLVSLAHQDEEVREFVRFTVQFCA
jgi:hypothetical protein